MIEFVKNISFSWFGDADFFRFQNAFLWPLLFLPLVYLALFMVVKRKETKQRSEWLSNENGRFVYPSAIKNRSLTHVLLVGSGLLFLAVAAMNPQFGSKKEEVMQKGVQVVFALDVSGSMLAEDIKPNRISRAKHAISKVIDRLGSDRIAIVVFSGAAYLQLPLTSDHAAAKMYLEEIEADMLPAKGTSIAEALKRSISALPKNAGKGSAIVLITDGENHDEEALVIAKECGDKDLPIYCIGIGTAEGATIPALVGGKKVGLKKDKQGGTVVTKLNEELLLEIAQNSKGQYVRSGTGSIGLGEIYDNIRGVEQQEYGAKKFTLYEDRFPIFMLFGVLFLIADFVLFNHKIRWSND